MIESGIGIRNPLFFMGVVERNDDPRLEGRVQVRAFSVHGKNHQNEVPTTDLPWAVCVAGNYSPNNPPPKLNSFVYGMFLDGRDAQHPLILGLIPTQFAEVIDPAKNGWGVIPDKDGNVSAHGSSPRDFGSPQNSNLARGENLNDTYIESQELNRVLGSRIAGTDETWDEPPTAYAAQYPYNKVVETAKHSVEIDDTPGAERIMIHHDSGSYIQMDSSGSVSYKSMKDTSDVRLENESIYVGGKSIVHINGDSHVYVHGNKTEEVNGDYRLLVKGNAEFGVGGQMNLNAGDQIQARAADIKLDANVSTLTIKAKKNIHIGSDETILMHTNFMNQTALLNFDTFVGFDYNLTSGRDCITSSSNIFATANGSMPSETIAGSVGIHLKSLTAPINLDSSTVVSMKAPTVNMDSVINLASGFSSSASAAIQILPTFKPSPAIMPQPPTKSTSLTQHKKSGTSSVSGLSGVFDDKLK
jgi:hypothetical protein